MDRLLHPFQFLRYCYCKWKHRKTFGPWMRWSLNKETRREILRNGWVDCP